MFQKSSKKNNKKKKNNKQTNKPQKFFFSSVRPGITLGRNQIRMIIEISKNAIKKVIK